MMSPTERSAEPGQLGSTRIKVLSRRGRRLRALATVVVAALFLLGYWRGRGDTFPFGPSGTSAGRSAVTGTVIAPFIQAVTSGGSLVVVRPAESGYRPGELAGQLPTLMRNPGGSGILL